MPPAGADPQERGNTASALEENRLQSRIESNNNHSPAMQTRVKGSRGAIPYAGDVVQMKPPATGYLGTAVICASVRR
jgi:hypothetical protein